MKQNHAKVILLFVNQKNILGFWTSIFMDLEKFIFSRICKILFFFFDFVKDLIKKSMRIYPQQIIT